MTDMREMFQNLSSLIFLNLYSFEINDETILNNAVKLLKNNVKFCANKNNMKNFLSENGKINDCTNICFKKNIKIDILLLTLLYNLILYN